MRITAIRERPGTMALSNSTRLPARSGETLVSPVMLPPGRARLATSPLPTGSPTDVNTIGIVALACFAARVAGVPAAARIRSTGRAASSAASSGRRSLLSAKRYSIAMFWPSTYPRSHSPWRNPALMRARASRGPGVRKPIIGTFAIR